MKNILRYIGTKNLNLEIAINKYKNIKIYCEPFSGSFCTGFNTAEKYSNIKYVYNDVDWDICNFWACAKENILDLIDKINETLNEINNYNEFDDKMHIIHDKMQCADRITKAAITYILQDSKRFKPYVNDNIAGIMNINIDTMLDYINVLKLVEINNTDYSKIISKYDSDNTLFLIDPPYYVDKVDSFYRSDCRFIYHREISEIVKGIKGKFILTYNINDYIKSLYKDFPTVEVVKNVYTKDLVIHNTDCDEHDINKIFGYIGE